MIEEEKNPVGRPSKYTSSTPELLRGYVDDGFVGDGDVIPTKAGFAVKIGVCEKTLDNWGREHDEFLRMLKYLLAKQHNLLINKGLTGDYNSTIAKMLMVSDHGHTERHDITSGGERIAPQVVSFENAVETLKQQAAKEVT